jgi:hypothetical protein
MGVSSALIMVWAGGVELTRILREVLVVGRLLCDSGQVGPSGEGR